ncbi:MAG: class I SAM-dependent methyltransferase [Actinobacteria bacterium]|nr:class I SAM-dependent methyltransferase [Actinomycetota bacterium]
MTTPVPPSMTALTAAAARAAHLIVDHEPLIFTDSLAATLLGDQADALLGYHRAHGAHDVLAVARATVTTRSRFTEERLAAAIARGTGQYVILGAGLDSFAWRSPRAARVRVIEADRPGPQRWKRDRLAAAGLAARGDVRFAGTDLETGSLAAALTAAGFDFGRPALVSWLGVIMYLTAGAVDRTLATLGRCAPGTELVAEYLVPGDLRDDLGRSYAEQVAPIAAERGEPWRTFLRPPEMAALLAAHGFAVTANVPQRDSVDAALWNRADPLRPAGLGWLAHARRTGPADGDSHTSGW